jgi:lipoprotein-releasing system permease protein
MVVLSIVNMTSALLILILERQNFIGSLKAMGLRNKIIYRIFIWHAASIIGKGILWGNAIGIGISLIQKYTGLIKLDPENYYVSTVPIQFDLPYILLLNAITLVVCLLAMILPSWYVATIQPASAIRKN